MFTILYGICLLVSVFMLVYTAQKNYHSIDIYQWTVVILLPVITMAYWLKTQVTGTEAASVLICFTYLDSTFLVTAVFFALMQMLGLALRPWAKIVAYGMAGIQVIIVGLCFNNDLYHRSVEVIQTSRGNKTVFESGPLQEFHYLYLTVLFLWLVWIVITAVRRRGSYSKLNFITFLLLPVGGFVIYAVEIATSAEFTILPIFYTAVEMVIMMGYDRAHLHDITHLIAEQHENHDVRGYVALGLDRRFLSCNEESLKFLPFLRDQIINAPLKPEDSAARTIDNLISAFENDGVTTAKFPQGEMTCVCEISYFSFRGNSKRQGYLLEISDGTEEQKAYDIITTYNERLNTEVKNKTEDIKGIQRKIVLGMADMIENRDNNTGGHVKRTSDIIHILVDEVIRQDILDIDEQMAQDIVRAAPTHDLGKISIDSNILNKPARLTDEEYAIMKTHSSKSGEMVKILLDGVEEERFVQVAYNVARFHHERWDGRGYPEGLVGSMIPLEARIMAVADVYDALVSKRVYKEPMSFEKSASIMCECMGTQFDPNLKSVFLGCREKMEDYYIKNDR